MLMQGKSTDRCANTWRLQYDDNFVDDWLHGYRPVHGRLDGDSGAGHPDLGILCTTSWRRGRSPVCLLAFASPCRGRSRPHVDD
jgi:hypothetical protein